MGSSSDIEFVTQAKPDTASSRVGTRAYVAATKGRGKAKAASPTRLQQALLDADDDSDELEVEVIPSRATSTNLQQPIARQSTTPNPLKRPAPASSSSQPEPLPSSRPVVEPPQSSSAPVSSTTTTKAAVKRRVPAKALGRAAPAVGGNSSDDLDDFFNRAAKPTGPPKRVPGRRPGSGAAAAGPSSSATKKRKMLPTSSPSGSSSSTSSSGSPGSSPEPADRDPSLVAAVKHSKLPEWTRNIGKASMQSGSAGRMAPGGKNRRKRRMSVDSEEEARREEEEERRRKVQAEVEMDDTDDSFASGGERKKGKGKGKGTPRGKGKGRVLNSDSEEEQRERSKSITPPVVVDARKMQDIIAEARASFTASTSPVRASSANLNPYAPASAARAPPTIKTVNLSSDTGDDEDDSTLDPDMLRIRNARRRQGGSALLSDDLQIISGGATTPPVKEARDEEEEQTTIRVSMVMDPDRTTSAAARRGYEAPIPVQMGMRQSFTTLFTQIATTRFLPGGADDLVLTYRQHRVYPFGTPTSLRIHSTVGADFRGYEKEVWEKVELARRKGRGVGDAPAGSPEEEEEVKLPAGLSPEGAAESPVAAAAPSTAGLFRLTIRGSATQSLNLAVKPTVLLSNLLGQYFKKFTIAPERQGKMWLEFDGERLDGKMKLEEWAEESGFEDEECIEVGEAKG